MANAVKMANINMTTIKIIGFIQMNWNRFNQNKISVHIFYRGFIYHRVTKKGQTHILNLENNSYPMQINDTSVYNIRSKN